MGKTAVLYKSRYGSTKQYAEWIAEDTGADLFGVSRRLARDLGKYDTVIVGGGLYAGGMLGISFLRKNAAALTGKKMIVFSVGASFPSEKNLLTIKRKNVPPALLERASFFHLRGALDYQVMNPLDRLGMWLLATMIRGKPERERDEEEKGILATYGMRVRFVNRETIAPIVRAAAQ